MYARLQRQNSFGPRETKSTLVISRLMELKILEGESSLPNASPIVLESINKSLESLINSHDSTNPVVHELPKFVRNTVISQCDLSEKELIDKRYGEYFEAYSLANNVQYIPVEIECLANMSAELSKSILALLVSVVFEYITEDRNLNEFELIKWGSTFLQRMGKILNLSDLDVSAIIKPVSESLELKRLGMNFDDLRVEKEIHVDYILDQLATMQDSINDFFKQTVGTFTEDEYNDIKDYSDIFKPVPKAPDPEPARTKLDDLSSLYKAAEPPSDSLSKLLGIDRVDNFNDQDFDLLLNDEPELDQEEESFKRNFIETYKKDLKYDLPKDGKHDRKDSSKDKEAKEMEKLSVNLNDLLNNFLTNEGSINTFDADKHESAPVVTDLENVKPANISQIVSDSQSAIDSNTNMEDSDPEEVFDDLLKDLEKSIVHRSSLPTNDFDNLLNDMSNLNLPPKKNKSISSKILSNISKKINRVFSINSEKSAKISHTPSIQSSASMNPHQDYLNNLLLIEKSPDIAAVLVRNLLLKYIISGFNDSRSQVVFGRFSTLLGVSPSSVLSIQNNIVSDLVGILDVSAAKTSTKKMSRRLKILSATVGGTALLALTAGMASPVLAVGIAFLGLSGTGVSTYLSSNEGTNILKNIFGLNVSLTQFKIKWDQLSNLQFIQLNANTPRDPIREYESARYTSRDSLKAEPPKEREDVNNNYIGICICVGNNVFLNEIFFFENESIDFRSNETIRHLDSEYLDIWKRQFPVPINDVYLLKWESKMLASLHRMLLKLTTLSVYDKSLELYHTFHNVVFTHRSNYAEADEEEEDMIAFEEVRDSSGGNRCSNVEGSSGNYYSHPRKDSSKGDEPAEEKPSTEAEFKDFYKDFKESNINWPLGLVQLCSNLDNCWLVCRNRAETCGVLLANAVCDKLLTGDRHISLVGYSMGARVIFYCLLALFERNKLNTVKDVVLMGLPSTAGYQEWARCASVVAGRLINVYNENDWVLAFLYRYTSNYRVAGLAPVIHERVENFNATSLFKSHVDYLENVSKITSFLNVQL